MKFDEFFNNDYYCDLYGMNMDGLAQKCNLEMFDPINSTASDTLINVLVYLRQATYNKRIFTLQHDTTRLKELAEKFAVAAFKYCICFRKRSGGIEWTLEKDCIEAYHRCIMEFGLEPIDFKNLASQQKPAP